MGNDEKGRNHLGQQKDQSVETQREVCECLSDVRVWGSLACVCVVWRGQTLGKARWKKMAFYWMSNTVMIFRGRQCKGSGLWETQSPITTRSKIDASVWGAFMSCLYVFYLQTPFCTWRPSQPKSLLAQGSLFKPALMNFLIEGSDRDERGSTDIMNLKSNCSSWHCVGKKKPAIHFKHNKKHGF